jgi:hypothetical protein
VNRNRHQDAVQRMRYYLGASSRIFSIAYWIPHANGDLERASPIQGFADGVLHSSHLLMFATGLPMDIREIYSGRSEILFSRAAGIVQPFVWPIMIEALPDLIRESPYFLNCVLSTEDMVQPARRILETAPRKWLHAGPKGSEAPISYKELDIPHFVQFLRDMVDVENDEQIRHIFAEFLNEEPFHHPPMSTDCPLYQHNIVTPNDGILHALHIDHRTTQGIPSNMPGAYIDAAIRSADAIRLLRKALLSPSMFSSVRHDLTLAVDSLTWPFLRGGIARLSRKAGFSKLQARVVSATLSREGYRSIVAHRNDENDEDVARAMESPEVKSVISSRAAELRVFTAGLTLLATSTFTPTIRLNPGLNRLRGSLSQISSCARGNGPHQNFKLKKLADRLSTSMESLIDKKMIAAIRRNARGTGSISLVSDLPLEWLKVDGVPLGILHDVSRIPATPGNVMLVESAKSQRLILGLRDFQEILVVRSFEKDDFIAKDLEQAITSPGWTKDGDEMPAVRFVDVSTVDEFVEAVNAYKGAVLIFDGHGAADDKTGVGSIVIGGRRVDVWDLKDRLSLPPIVLLSACDTFPVDGSHGSSAIGMLSLGATTVLGTLLPIHSKRAAIFIARLIYRIAKFVPIVTAGQRLGVDWRYIMSGMLRMTYASEVISQFEKDFRVDFLEGLRTKTNVDINSRDKKWLTQMIRRLAAVVNKPVRDIWAWFDERLEMVDSLKYVQLGRPELIAVHEASPQEVLEV